MFDSMQFLKKLYSLKPSDVELMRRSQDELLQMMQSCASDIKNIFINYPDKWMGTHLSNKLANEYRGDLISFLNSGVDPDIKRIIGINLLPSLETSQMVKIINFFHWIQNRGSYDLDQMFHNDDITRLWKSSNSIYFFFHIEPDQQDLLINKHNSSYS